MKTTEIKIGHTYVNRGAGMTKRKVIAIGAEHRPNVFWNATGKPKNPDEPGVLFEQYGRFENSTLYLSSFAAWCGSDVTPNAKVRGGSDSDRPA